MASCSFLPARLPAVEAFFGIAWQDSPPRLPVTNRLDLRIRGPKELHTRLSFGTVGNWHGVPKELWACAGKTALSGSYGRGRGFDFY